MTTESTSGGAASDIAIVGLAGRFPGARDAAAFWRNLRDGVESVRRLTDVELRRAGVPDAHLAAANYVKAAAVLDGLDLFDAGFFGFSAREAAILDPQHRQFLETTWEALEDAGRVPERFPGAIGVFAGCGMNSYFMFNLLTNPALVESVGMFLLRHTGNDKDFLTTRVSYCLNLTGPSVGIQTACSTSLVAVHAACQSLLSGECDMALAGGVTIEIPHLRGYFYEPGEILSPDGHCRPFDVESKGTVFGSGSVVVVLRRLADAIADGDRIRAVVKGSAINNDGSSKVGYLAPSVDGQAKAIREALGVAGVPARSVTYVETHGTGTPVGDPIEIAALTQAFRAETDARGYCAIGSLKSNIGHLDTAAGVASLIKVILALEHRALPPSINFTAPNPAIEFGETPFVVNAALTEWTSDGPRRAGISSLGVGGTNAHVIVEEAPAPPDSAPPRSRELLLISARSAAAVDAAADRLADHVDGHRDLNVADAAYTLQIGRRAFAHRRAVVCGGAADASQVLRTRDPRRTVSGGPAAGVTPGVVFLFPGGGAQFPNMGVGLYQEAPVYRASVDRCLEWIRSHAHLDLRPLLFPAPGDEAAAAQVLERPSHSVLTVFVTEYALAQVWLSWGVTPVAMTGHSLGEYTAACLSGALSLEDALSIVATRGEIFDRLPAGAMLSVPLDEVAVRPLLGSRLALAAVNAPELSVVSGAIADIDALAQQLAARGIETRRLHIGVAAHSPMLDPMLDEFARHVAAIRMVAPTVPFISNRTGHWVRAEDLAKPDYWVRHLRETVRFSLGLRTLIDRPGDRVYLEVGPGHALTSLARLHLAGPEAATAVSSMRHPEDHTSDLEALHLAAGRLWVAGVDVDWSATHAGARRRVSLPAYPFEHQPYWIEPGVVTHGAASVPPAVRPPERLPDPDHWFWTPSWRVSARPAPASAGEDRWLIFAGDEVIGRGLTAALRRRSPNVVTVHAGPSFDRVDDRAFVVRPGSPEDIDALAAALDASGAAPTRIVHAWLASPTSEGRPSLDAVNHALQLGFETLVSVARVLGAADTPEPVAIDVITAGLERVAGEPVVAPERATALGPVLVMPRELPHVRSRAIDVALPAAGAVDADVSSAIDDLLSELLADGPDPRVALRGGKRWTQEPGHASLPPVDPTVFPRPGATYLITGGLSGIGLETASRMAAAARVNLVLTGRRGLPPRDRWAGTSAGDASARAIRAIAGIEAGGSHVLAAAGDVASPADVARIVADARGQFGRIDGVLHAAGVVEDAPLQVKSPESIARVLSPKVHGVTVLDDALADDPPDLLVLFSSTSAFLGLPGQVDYTAANAFLDAYARARPAWSPSRTVAIAWGIWRDIGIAARAVGAELDVAAPAATATAAIETADAGVHPMLGRVIKRDSDEVVYEALYRVDTHWVLDEHRLKTGQALVPGTGFIEMARAAFADIEGPGPVELRDLYFLASLEVADGDGRRVLTSMRRGDEGWTFTVTSDSHGDWIEHARGAVTRLASEAPHAAIPRPASNDRVVNIHTHGGETRQEHHLRFGPRWKSLGEVRYGAGHAVAQLELPPAFTADLDVWTAHPALVDMGSAIGLPLLDEYDQREDLYIPLSFNSVRIHAPLEPRLTSIATPVDGVTALTDSAEFDVVLAAPDGRVLLEASGFLMRRATPADVAARVSAGRRPDPATPDATRLSSLVREGIPADDGWAALRRVVQSSMAEIVVSSMDDDALRAAANAPHTPMPRQSTRRAAVRAVALGDVERTIAAMWSELLGVPEIGPDDDFFELGGHSLIAVRLIARIEKAFPKRLRLATLFEARTVRALAEIVGERKPMSQWISLVPIRTAGSKPPFFCVHGVGGEVLSYSALASRLEADQPFIAFRARGHEAGAEPLATIEEQAAFYISEMVAYDPNGPYYIGGYSHGGRVALEMALQLTASGRSVAFVGILDTWPYEAPRSLPQYALRWLANLPLWAWYEFREAGLAENLGRMRRGAAIVRRKLAGRLAGSARGRGAAVHDVTDVVDLGGLPESVRRLFQANFAAFKAYTPSRRYDGPITLFRSVGQPLMGWHGADLGWGGVTTGAVTVRRIPGNHTSILAEPRVVRLAEAIGAELAEARRREAPAFRR